MSSSKAVLKALSQIVKTQLNFVALVVYDNVEYFICFG